jgi:hypothetical protein
MFPPLYKPRLAISQKTNQLTIMNSTMAPPTHSNEIAQLIFSSETLKPDVMRMEPVPVVTIPALPAISSENRERQALLH